MTSKLWLLTIAVWTAAAPAACLGADAAAGGADPLTLNPDLAIWTLVVFLVLLAVLKAFAWGPIVNALQAREQGITDQISAAAAKHEEAKLLLVEHEARLAAAADDVRAMLEEARRDAEHTKQEIVNEARAAADAERQRDRKSVV